MTIFLKPYLKWRLKGGAPRLNDNLGSESLHLATGAFSVFTHTPQTHTPQTHVQTHTPYQAVTHPRGRVLELCPTLIIGTLELQGLNPLGESPVRFSVLFPNVQRVSS